MADENKSVTPTTLRDEMKHMRWIASFAPVQDILTIPVVFAPGAPGIGIGALIYRGTGLTIIEVRPQIDVDPNIVANPQNTHILLSGQRTMNPVKCRRLYRHFPDEFITFVPDGQSWWAYPVGANGFVELTVGTVMPVY